MKQIPPLAGCWIYTFHFFMSYRKVNRLLYAEQINMSGLMVRQPFPTQQVDKIDPFLLLHHGRIKIPAERNALTLGVGPHPHRGFSPITFVYEGAVHHRDSRGNSSVVVVGGTQWMHAGMGIIHSERPSQELADEGGYMEIIQLWLNVPQKNKMVQPEYQPLSAENTPSWNDETGKVKVGVVAGNYKGIQGPIKTFTSVNALRVEIKDQGEHEFSIPATHNCFLYLIKGKLQLAGYGVVENKHLVLFENNAENFKITAREDSQLLVMSGASINEPIAQQGPFVMNTDTEILVAMRDYQMGKMGILIEE